MYYTVNEYRLMVSRQVPNVTAEPSPIDIVGEGVRKSAFGPFLKPCRASHSLVLQRPYALDPCPSSL